MPTHKKSATYSWSNAKRKIGIPAAMMYVFDWGAPVGFRLATRRPGWVTGLVVQNGNAYEEGLSAGARDFIALRPDVEGDEEKVRRLLTLTATRGQYVGGTTDPEMIAPDGWTLDQHFLDLPGRGRIMVDLAFDYHTNVELYPRWQAWLRAYTPPTLIAWGRNDPFFMEPGARAYLRDVPDAELHLFDTGHFALEENLLEIAPLIAAFLDRTWRSPVTNRPRLAHGVARKGEGVKDLHPPLHPSDDASPHGPAIPSRPIWQGRLRL